MRNSEKITRELQQAEARLTQAIARGQDAYTIAQLEREVSRLRRAVKKNSFKNYR